MSYCGINTDMALCFMVLLLWLLFKLFLYGETLSTPMAVVIWIRLV